MQLHVNFRISSSFLCEPSLGLLIGIAFSPVDGFEWYCLACFCTIEQSGVLQKAAAPVTWRACVRRPSWAPAPESGVEGLAPGPEGCWFPKVCARAPGTPSFENHCGLTHLPREGLGFSRSEPPSLRWPACGRAVFTATSCSAPLGVLALFDHGSQVIETCSNDFCEAASAGLCSGALGAGGRGWVSVMDSGWAGVCLLAAASSLTPLLLEAGAVCPSDLH